jgi:hypothetical protein
MNPRIDTLAISKRLAEGGFSRDQADVTAAVWNEAIDMAVRDLATKDDISALRAELARTASDFARANEKNAAEQKAAIAEQKTAIAEAMDKQIAWTIGTIVAVMRAGIAIARFF